MGTESSVRSRRTILRSLFPVSPPLGGSPDQLTNLYYVPTFLDFDVLGPWLHSPSPTLPLHSCMDELTPLFFQRGTGPT